MGATIRSRGLHEDETTTESSSDRGSFNFRGTASRPYHVVETHAYLGEHAESKLVASICVRIPA